MAKSRIPPERGNSPTYLALGTLIGLGFAFLFLLGLVLRQILGFALVLFGLFSFVALQYMLWGWWMPRVLKDDEDEPL